MSPPPSTLSPSPSDGPGLTYSAPSTLVTIHKTVRVAGGNQIPWTALTWNAKNEASFNPQPLGSYIVGVVVPGVVFLAFFLVWFLAFCIYRCRTLGKRLKATRTEEVERRSVVFIVCLVLCMICLIVALGLNTTIDEGFHSMQISVRDVANTAIYTAINVQATFPLLNDMGETADVMNQQCSNSLVPFPGAQLSTLLSGSSTNFNSTLNDLKSYSDAILNSFDTVEFYLNWRSNVAMLLVLVYLFIVFWMFLLITWSAFERHRGNEQAVLKRPCTIRLTVFLFWFLILVVFVLWIWIATHYVVSIVGSDFCTPSPFTNLITGLAISFANSKPGVSGVVEHPVMINITDDANPCEGVSTVFNQGYNFIRVAENLTTKFLKDSEEAGVPLNPECLPLSQQFFSNATAVLELAVSDETCFALVAAFRGFFFSGMCDGVTAGAFGFFLASLLATLFLFLGLTFNLDVTAYALFIRPMDPTSSFDNKPGGNGLGAQPSQQQQENSSTSQDATTTAALSRTSGSLGANQTTTSPGVSLDFLPVEDDDAMSEKERRERDPQAWETVEGNNGMGGNAVPAATSSFEFPRNDGERNELTIV